MIYEFTTDKVGSMKLQNFRQSVGKTFKIEDVNAQISFSAALMAAYYDSKVQEQA